MVFNGRTRKSMGMKAGFLAYWAGLARVVGNEYEGVVIVFMIPKQSGIKKDISSQATVHLNNKNFQVEPLVLLK
jgi:hypothetical protein